MRLIFKSISHLAWLLPGVNGSPESASRPCIEPGNPKYNGYNDSFNEKLRGELLDAEICYSPAETKYLIERCRNHYDRVPATGVALGVICPTDL